MSTGSAAQAAPQEVQLARQTLTAAEHSYDDHGDSQRTRDFAYAAKRRAELAQVQAQLQSDLQARDVAMATAQSSTVALTSGYVKAAPGAGPLREAQLLDDLARVAMVSQDARGTVISLSGIVLFATGDSKLQQGAQERLAEVATALSHANPSMPIRIEGYADSQGPASTNDALSKARAETVRQFFIDHGINADRMTAEGKGSTAPVAANNTSTGRAYNRRVELIVQTAPKK